VERISEAYMLPVIALLLEGFPATNEIQAVWELATAANAFPLLCSVH